MERDEIRERNRLYWDGAADNWFGVTALPEYGVQFVTEAELGLFGDVRGKRLLEIGCGSGHSLAYHAQRGAGELWGLDISQRQLENARHHLEEGCVQARLICGAMEDKVGIPPEYFDYVYSIYAMGWAVDLDAAMAKAASYLKKGGALIFSWKHPISHCVDVQGEDLLFRRAYFDESWFSLPLDDGEMTLCSRMISTYVNALAGAGFAVERMIEQSDDKAMLARGEMSDRIKKARMLPLSFVIKARKI